MFVRKSKYELLESKNNALYSEKEFHRSGAKYKQMEIMSLKQVIDDLKITIKAQEDIIAKLEAKDIKIVNEQSKKFIEVEHASIKAMNETIPKLRKQGWSDKLKVKIQGNKVFTVHEREVKGDK
ncbi:hypothetical protein [Bacillus phage BC-T25]|nr:hypothetical protein [Bacillus phage BC-T25]